MRLTRFGRTCFVDHLQIKNYPFTVNERIRPKILLLLERNIRYPYYIVHHSKILIFDEVTAIMLQLHGSDLETYLNNLEENG